MIEVSSSPHTRRASAVIKALLIGASAAAMVPSLPATAQTTAASRATQFNIAPQSLESAIMAFGLQSGMRVTADQGVLAGRQSPGVSGNLGSFEALSRLLAGTGVTWRQIDGRSVALVRAPESAQGDAIQLGPVKVSGAGEGGDGGTILSSDASATEGTRSYTTRAPSSTSTGLNLTLRETPQSISVITRERMDDQRLISITDVLQQTPGINLTRDGGERFGISARGGAVNSFQYDGVLTQVQNTTRTVPQTALDTALYDRIEVLRGATGLMTGAGDPGGLVNLIRKRPTRELQGYLQTNVGSWNFYRAEADISGPLIKGGALRARAVAMAQDNDTFMDAYSQKSNLLYGVIEADLGATTLVRASIDYQRYRPEGSPGVAGVFSNGQQTHFSRSTSSGANWGGDDFDTYNYALALEQRLPYDWMLKANANFMTVDRHFNTARYQPSSVAASLDQETGQANADVSEGFARQDQQGVLVALSGPLHLFGQEHELYFSYNYNRYFNDYAASTSTDSKAFNYYTWNNQFPQPSGYAPALTQYFYYKQQGINASARLKPLANVNVILGGRLTNFDYENYLSYPATGTGFSYGDTKARGKFTPYAGVVVDLNRHHSLYASYADIFQPQSSLDRNGNILPPVIGSNYEIGWKGAFRDDTLNASVALYQVIRDNVGELDDGYLVPGTTDTQAYRPVKGAKTRGIEAEINGEVLPGWNLSASYTHVVTRDAEGVRSLTQIPKDTVKFWTTYRFDVAERPLTLGGGVNWTSATYYPFKTFRIAQGDYAVANLMARYEFNDSLSASVNLNNLFDKTYYVSMYTLSVYGQPRNVMGTVRYGF
ncbi:outer membrane receptor for ferric coprogen and ferric-rhodotorulic acid [Novosphingobium sp. PhB57]|nr:outer membrane receptor for ferric coprogen and ferric-rhodotorulic acid [Novosphingobium sp. PhB57]